MSPERGIPINLNPRTQMVNLTNMWKASGGVAAKRVPRWLQRDSVQQFIETVGEKLNVPEMVLLKSTKGRYGGTYAHYQIALAYAKYLSPEFHMWANEVLMERLEEEGRGEGSDRWCQ